VVERRNNLCWQCQIANGVWLIRGWRDNYSGSSGLVPSGEIHLQWSRFRLRFRLHLSRSSGESTPEFRSAPSTVYTYRPVSISSAEQRTKRSSHYSLQSPYAEITIQRVNCSEEVCLWRRRRGNECDANIRAQGPVQCPF
jgi:hypothetical protein